MKIICIGRNYSEHIKELGNTAPKSPLLFLKPETAVLKQEAPFYYPSFSKDIHYECELVLRIGKHGKSIDPKFAESYIESMTLGIDFTARDLQSELKANGHPWEIAKGFDHSAVIGSFVEYVQEDPILFEFFKNQERVQSGDTRKMICDIPHLIALASKYFTLKKGDLIFTGSPSGVGPIAIGDEYEGTLMGHKVLKCVIK